MKQILCHLFLPHTSNNHRAKLLHPSTLLLVIVAFFLGQFFLTYLKTDYPAVLGSSIDISTEKLLEITNKDREEQKLPPLKLNSVLSQAAAMKAEYMFEKNFWAHDAPDGTTPWYFIKKAGYTYTYAGENLARGFTDSSDVVDAWMNSPTHRENMLSGNYTEIGFAIKKGILLGEETTLVVEMFGNTGESPIVKTPESSSIPKEHILPAAIDANAQTNSLAQVMTGYGIKTTSLLDGRDISMSIGLLTLSIFIGILLVDLLIIERKKIVRLIGHNIDHIFFLGAIFVIMVLTLQGVVL